jgi:DNA-binding GntR family transcriptional regulator
MQTKQISVNRALKELKTLDQRIQTAIGYGTFVTAAKNSATKIQGLTKDELKNSFKANLDKVNDLVSYKNALKAALVASNAATKVTVGSQEFAVAEAIYMKEAAKVEQTFIGSYFGRNL